MDGMDGGEERVDAEEQGELEEQEQHDFDPEIKLAGPERYADMMPSSSAH